MLILDTHAWIFWVNNPGDIPRRSLTLIDKFMKKNEIFISSVSVWEVGLLVTKKRLKLTMDLNDWIKKSEGLSFINFVPVNNEIFIRSIFLSNNFHQDPADRIIVATSNILGARLITKDERIRNSGLTQAIWD